MNTDLSPIILAAGGTGGHIYPAEALAEELVKRGERVVFITDKRSKGYTYGVFGQVEMRTIRAGTGGKNIASKIKGAANLGIGVLQARRTLKKLQPKVVVGFGGYPSFPTMFAATKLGLPTLIHEQNSVLGRANRMLASKVDAIAASFPAMLMVDAKDESKITVTGNPVRASIRALRNIPYPDLLPDGKLQILVTGGSQGASIFSQILPAALAALPASMRTRIRLDQQCREADLEVTRAAYDQLGVSANLSSFFSDIPARLASSHLVIARSGASTIAELSAAGRPAILVPYPHSMDNHQYFNANAFEDAGGGWVMAQEGFTAASLSARLEAFLGLPSTLSDAAKKACTFGRIDAAEALADAALKLVQTKILN